MQTQFKFTTNAGRLPQETLRLKVKQWANRRPYPVSWIMTNNTVKCWLEPPSNAEHNRAVESLARICQRELDRYLDVDSRLIKRHETRLKLPLKIIDS